MLESLITTEALSYLLMAVLLLLVVSLILISLLWRRLATLRSYQSRYESDLHAMVVAAVGVGERVHLMERRQRQLDERQEQLDHGDTGAQTYQQAIKRAQGGASAEELIEIYGLTRGEAELIALLHRMERH